MLDREGVTIALALWAFVATVAGVVVAKRFGDRANELQRENNDLERRNGDLQARLVAIEERLDQERRAATSRAELHAENVPAVHGGRQRRALVITNRGLAPAREIDARINGQPIGVSPFSPWEECAAELQAGGSARFLLSDAQLTAARAGFEVELAWSDDSGGRRQRTFTLSTT